MLYDCPPAFDQLRVFWCLYYAHNLNHGGDNFAPRVQRCIFLIYSYGKKEWCLYDLEKEDFTISHDVVFQEDVFPNLTTPHARSTMPTASSIDASSNMVIDDHKTIIENRESTSTLLDSSLTSTTSTKLESHASTEELGHGAIDQRNLRHLSLIISSIKSLSLLS